MSPVQSRMARAGLNWTSDELAKRAGLGVNTVTRFEQGKESYLTTVRKLQRTFEAAGVEFLDENGLRLHQPDAIRER